MAKNNNQKPVKIMVALPSILYAPIYVFQEMQRINGIGEYRFHIELPDKYVNDPQIEIRPLVTIGQTEVRLDAFAPIVYDPLFSPIVNDKFIDKYPDIWFGVGDPVRLRRMTFGEERSDIDYRIIGTLVNKLAYWVVAERKCGFKSTEIDRYNLIACHSRGMTGYHIADHIFKRSLKDKPSINPLAPTANPGSEVEYYFNILKIDLKRRSGILDENDPVWMGAVTTEIGQIHKFLKSEQMERKVYLYPVHKHFPDKLGSDAFIMTSIIARRYENKAKNSKVKRAAEVLRKGVINAITLLNKEPKQFAKHLKQFYICHTDTFMAPDAENNMESCDLFMIYYEQLRRIYSASLCTNSKVRKATDEILRRSIASDIRNNGAKDTDTRVKYVLDQLKTSTWGEYDKHW